MSAALSNTFTWDAEVLRKYPDGMRILRLTTESDLRQLGVIQRHCSVAHKYWAQADPPLEYFFVMSSEAGYPLNTLHCKVAAWVGVAHPLDSDETARQWVVDSGWSHLNTTYYDGYVDGMDPVSLGIRQVNPYTQRVIDAKRRFRQLRVDALKLGPLGKDHPMKYTLDEANRNIGTWEKQEKDAALDVVTARGRTFEFEGQGCVILSATGRGTDGIRQEKYVSKWDEFLGKEVEVAFGTAR